MSLFAEIVRTIAGLAITLGLIGVSVVVLRRYGPGVLGRLQTPRGARRLAIIETLVLDPSRRLVLVRVDAEERLILLGDGQALPPQSSGTTS